MRSRGMVEVVVVVMVVVVAIVVVVLVSRSATSPWSSRSQVRVGRVGVWEEGRHQRAGAGVAHRPMVQGEDAP